VLLTVTACAAHAPLTPRRWRPRL